MSKCVYRKVKRTINKELKALYLGLLVVSERPQLLQLCVEPHHLRLQLLLLRFQLTHFLWKKNMRCKFVLTEQTAHTGPHSYVQAALSSQVTRSLQT